MTFSRVHPMTDLDPDILDDLFHGCAWAAYMDQAREEHGRPGIEATRRRAFRYYEEELKEKNARATSQLTRADDAVTRPENVEVSDG